MAYVSTVPAAIAAAATQLEGIGNSFSAESAAAATPTTAIAPAASDEVSALQAGVFSTYGQLYQTVSADAQAIYQQFVTLLQSSSNSYQGTESANAARAAANSAVRGVVRGLERGADHDHRRHLRPDRLAYRLPACRATSAPWVSMRWGTSPPPNRT